MEESDEGKRYAIGIKFQAMLCEALPVAGGQKIIILALDSM
jgi:hypothetical protein